VSTKEAGRGEVE